ncbi:MAG: sugar ABC transporter ATP-binding protein [Acidobacteria bacterium]|nr:sugar ABC transporter ATP-binding protein [Acidobacteriota bacterium]MBI3425254.1 sugar ABC transporter ATP-binding protein [Acidobacteriota bacterium]
MANTATVPVLEMRGIGKAFSGNQVLADVNLTARAGEVLALVGENGAGKSTLMKILAGVHQPDGGEISLDGQPIQFARPADALAAGIAMIYQELSLAPHLTVAENIFLGREPLKLRALGLINQRALNDRARQLLNEYGFKLDPQARVGRLSAAARQLVEITRAIVEAKRVIVMDEPTSSLTNHEVEELFRLIRNLKQRGLAVIYISHRLEELDEIADQLTILRDGRAVYNGVWGEITTDEMIRQMAGRELKEIFPPRHATLGEVKLRVRELSHPPKFENASFEARAGEVVGIAGLAGAGRTEMLEAIFGAHPATSGAVEINGASFIATQPNAAIKRGMSLLTEDRKRTGLCLNLPMSTNITLANVRALVKGGRLQRRRETEAARQYIQKLGIKPPTPGKLVGRLSGGNQQKSLLARWLFAESKVFMLDEPTRGVDVAARTEIYREINELAEAGACVVMVSSDLPELLGMADRILVMRRGKLVAELNAQQTSQEEILKYAALEE